MEKMDWVPDRDALRKQTMCQNPIYLLKRINDDGDDREFLPDVYATPQEAQQSCPRGYEPYAVFAKGLLAALLDAHWPGPDAARQEAESSGKLIEMGQITTLSPYDDQTKYPMALLIEFSDESAIRRAIASGQCQFGRCL